MNPAVSVIIPVFREGAVIAAALDRLHALDGASHMECIVVDGCPRGSTLEAVRRSEAVRLVAPKGRGAQMNRGAILARGAAYLFLHADTRLPQGALAAVRRALASPAVAGGAFRLGIDSPAKAFRLIEAMVALRTRLTRVPYGDQAIFIRSGVFHRLGGYREVPLMEDVDLMRRLKRLRRPIAILPLAVKTSARRWEKEGLLFCTLRNWALVTLYLAGRAPELLAKHYA